MSATYQVGSLTSPVVAGTTQPLVLGFEDRMLWLWGMTAPAYNTFYDEALYTDGHGYIEGSQKPQTNYFAATRFIFLFNKAASLALTSRPEVIFIGGNLNWSSSVFQQIAIDTIDATTVNLNWPFTNNTAYQYEYAAIGGADVTRVEGDLTTPTSPGLQVIPHGLPQAPAFVQFSFASFPNATFPHPGHCFSRGFTDGTAQGVTAFQINGDSSGAAGANPSVERSYQRTDKCIAILDAPTGTVIAEAEIVSIDATNITLNWTIATRALTVFTLAIAGITCHVGSFRQPSTASVVAVASGGITPQMAFVQSSGRASTTAIDPNLRYTFGITDGTHQHALWIGATSGVTFFNGRNASRYHASGSTVFSAHPTGAGVGTIDAAGTIAFVSGGFNATFGSSDGVLREWIYVVFGVPAATPPVASALTLNCATGVFTLTGTNLTLTTTLAVTIDGTPTTVVEQSRTSTAIVFTLPDADIYASSAYCATVSDGVTPSTICATLVCAGTSGCVFAVENL